MLADKPSMPANKPLCRKARSRLGTRRKMKNQSVQALLEDIRLVSEQNYEIVEAVRAFTEDF